jgi:hypothetical protein
VAVRENESGGKEGRTASGAYFVYEEAVRENESGRKEGQLAA